MKKSGIVLMMTLILITVMMGIVALILSQSSNLSKLVQNGFTQSLSMRVVNDLERELPALLSSVRGAEELDLAMRLPLQIEKEDQTFKLKAILTSPYSKININRLISTEGSLNEPYHLLFTRLFTLYPISQPDIFYNLVSDTMDKDADERGNDTEISLRRPDFQNGAIDTPRQFRQILERYIELSGDTAILAIPWNDYIGFVGEKMDINTLNPQVLALILPDTASEKIRSMSRYKTKAYVSAAEAIAAEPQLAPVFDTYFFVYQGGTSYTLLCDVVLQENFQNQHLTFQYDLLEKKVKHVEFL